MRLCKARIRMYRSIRDTGEFEVENGKTILVGPNEAGKTVILQALQQLHAPRGNRGVRRASRLPSFRVQQTSRVELLIRLR